MTGTVVCLESSTLLLLLLLLLPEPSHACNHVPCCCYCFRRLGCYLNHAIFPEQATPMHIAVQRGRLDCATELLRFFVSN